MNSVAKILGSRNRPASSVRKKWPTLKMKLDFAFGSILALTLISGTVFIPKLHGSGEITRKVAGVAEAAQGTTRGVTDTQKAPHQPRDVDPIAPTGRVIQGGRLQQRRVREQRTSSSGEHKVSPCLLVRKLHHPLVAGEGGVSLTQPRGLNRVRNF